MVADVAKAMAAVEGARAAEAQDVSKAVAAVADVAKASAADSVAKAAAAITDVAKATAAGRAPDDSGDRTSVGEALAVLDEVLTQVDDPHVLADLVSHLDALQGSATDIAQRASGIAEVARRRLESSQ
jgi:hypothetical protein